MVVKFYDISVVCLGCKQTIVFTSSKRKKREENTSTAKPRWMIGSNLHKYRSSINMLIT